MLKSFFRFALILAFIGLILGAAAVIGLYQHFAPTLPNVETLRDIKFQTPLKVLSSDGKLIAEFGEKKRTPITYEKIPETFVQALQSAEDSRFFEHYGIDLIGLSRAAYQLVSTGKIKSGGSTITMQVAKNFFLTRERTFERKFSEIFLALKIEQSLSKQEIFELYVNKIYLGHRSYGIQAAANVYYGKNIDELSLPQLAMIAGLPKAPSTFNPITNPTRAIERRNWILGRMHSLSYISLEESKEAQQAPVTAKYHTTEIELYAPYIAEMVRSELYGQYGDELYTDGFTVYTTLNSKMQSAANTAVRNGLVNYVKRHGYRGPEKQHNIADLSPEEVTTLLKKETSFAQLEPAIILNVDKKSATAQRKNGEVVTLPWEGLKWAKKFKTVNYAGPMPKNAAKIVQTGDLVRILNTGEYWELSQVPKAQGALISMTPQSGAIRSLVGGFSFTHNKFNRATQAHRQPGSNFKPFIYAAAMENGFTPASIINDAPVVLQDKGLDGNWRPQNSSKKFSGPTRLRVGLYKSRNLVSIRLLRSLGFNKGIEYLSRFGFDPKKLPANLSLALGSADVTPLELVTGYAALANGGYKVEPYFIDRINDQYGQTIFTTNTPIVCHDCSAHTNENKAADPTAASTTNIASRIMDKRTNFLLYSIMQDVIRRGTGTRAKVLNRSDLAGKTGTTNEQKDAWFTGFNNKLVTTSWVGYDQPAPLGRSEFGGTAALPIWVDFMREALADTPEAPIPRPNGIVQVRIHSSTGLRASSKQSNTLYEYFKAEQTPHQGVAENASSNGQSTEDLF
ncbi:penicillin-binding protein 1A [Neptunomonas japonica]|uniref:Penicillin-binding protein 1A n=1 Tax=Neptunomonas japonica JAMM 1380 TaxID=1441457 RepID=A0A7R6PFN8_9GAMM|nr:penicillin-binding protein 1A [Neptunomonas japonica]BBB28311.1 penicillin-binding protein 1A [Neptunomonas japonica JAMM 1380]